MTKFMQCTNTSFTNKSTQEYIIWNHIIRIVVVVVVVVVVVIIR